MNGKRSNSALFSRESVHWSTPSELYNHYMDLGYYDPCPLNSSFDGLSQDWGHNNFVNPPYDNIFAFAVKAVEESKKGKDVVLLVPARTDTKWFHFILENSICEIDFIKGRLKFGGSKRCAPFPSIIITIHGHSVEC